VWYSFEPINMNKKEKIMKIISTKVHGILDYMMGVILIAAPWIFGFADNSIATMLPCILGALTIVYSLMTDYELGLSDNISMRTHLVIDFISGILLAASPWIFGFADVVYLPHLILGIVEIGAVALTTSKVGEHVVMHGHRKHEHVRMGSRSRTAHG
jgi:hypothetical protein